MRFAFIFVLPAVVTASQPLPLFFFHENGGLAVRTPRFAARFDGAGAELKAGGRRIAVRYPGARPAPTGAEPLGARMNMMTGDDPSHWRLQQSLFGKVVYRDLYSGIDLMYSGTDALLKSEFLVRPAADPDVIRMRFEGAEGVVIEHNGDLTLHLNGGEFRDSAPVVWQVVEGETRFISCRYRVLADGSVGFSLAPYDKSLPLVIDPTITYSTFLGGNRIDSLNAIAVDSSGNAYVAGYTDSLDMPVAGALQSTGGGNVDVFVAKLNPSGTTLLYATYIGGNGDDRAFGIKVDAYGNAHLTGWTGSTNFPKAGAFQGSLNGPRDAFVAKLSSNGASLLYSTYFGGSGLDSGNGIALDVWGNAFIAGETASTNLFVTGGAPQAINRGGQDAFVTKLSVIGTVLYSTYLGGAGTDRAAAIAVDIYETAYVTGSTTSVNFPMVSPVQSINRGGQEVFVTRVGYYGNVFTFSTYLGGTGGAVASSESGYAIAVDSSRNVYLTGTTSSTDFPLLNAFQTAHGGGGQDVFVTKVNAAGGGLIYSTYLGGTGIDTGRAIAVDSAGQVYVAGETASSNLPLSNPIQASKRGATDAFVSKFNSSGSALSFSTYYGGNGADRANAIAWSSAGVWFAGQTASGDFPVVSAAQNFGLAEANGFVVRLNDAPTSPTLGGGPGAPNSAPVAGAVTPSAIMAQRQMITLSVSDPNGGSTIAKAALLISTGPASPGCHVSYQRASNQLVLLDESGATSNPVTPGAAGVLENVHCSVYAASSHAAVSGLELQVSFDISLKPAFTGEKKIFAGVWDDEDAADYWVQKGTWTGGTAPNGAPAVVSINPASSSASRQSLAITISDPNGAQDLESVAVLIGSPSNFSCQIEYRTAEGKFYLLDDGGVPIGPITTGSSSILENTQCRLNASGSFAAVNGNQLTVQVDVNLLSPYTGTHKVYGSARDKAGLSTGWVERALWTSTAAGIVLD